MTTLIVAIYAIMAVLLIASAIRAFYEYVLASDAPARRQAEKEAMGIAWNEHTESK